MVKVELKMGKCKWSPKQEEGGSVTTTYSYTYVIKEISPSDHVLRFVSSLRETAGGGDAIEKGELSI